MHGMYVKITRSGKRQYLQLVESVRNPQGSPRQRHVATLGRLDQLVDADVDALINGLLRATGRPPLGGALTALTSRDVVFGPALTLGDVWLLLGLWRQLGFAQALARALKGRRVRFDVEALLRVLVFNRLSDPASKLGVLRWLQTVYLPGVDRAKVAHQHLLRAMDVLVEHKEALEREVSALLLPLLDEELSVVFYDLTTVLIHGEGEVAEDLRQYGHAKEIDGIARQFAVGLVQTAEGIPLAHEVFEGNVYEAATLQGMVERILERFPIRRLVLVADRGLLTSDNLETLEGIRLPEDRKLDYILAVPARRYGEYAELCRRLHADTTPEPSGAQAEQIAETTDAQQRRVVVAHSPARATQQCKRRDQQIAEIERLAEGLVDRLNAQDTGRSGRGRRLSDAGAYARVRQAVQEARLGRIIQTDVEDGRFFYQIDEEAREQARLLDGKLILLTNVTDLSPEGIVARYKSLADIERGFRVLKSDIEIAPVYHRLPDRIRAHALICFLALVLHRVMRMRLKQAGSPLSPTRAIELAQRIHYHQVMIRNRPQRGVTKLTAEQKELFDQLEIERPTSQALDNAV